jgi:pectin methylesterase-like acyl-CoA thioesterase
VWGKEQAEAFQTLKNILSSKPLLEYQDFKNKYIVTYVASSTGIGSVLSTGPLGHQLPAACFSLVLTKAEINFSTIERQMTAIILSFKQFRQYIWGYNFTIVTYHKPLTWVFKMKDSDSRLCS